MIPISLLGLTCLWAAVFPGAIAQVFDGLRDDLGNEHLNGRRRVRLDNDEESLQNLDYYTPPNYEFEYQVHGGGNVLGHMESRDEAKISGKYYVDLPNGMRQTVVYTADEYGFHPIITYERIGSGNAAVPARAAPASDPEPFTFNGNYQDHGVVANNRNAPSPSASASSSEEVQAYGLTPPNLKRKRRKQRKVVIVRNNRDDFPEFGQRIRRRSQKRQST